MTPTLLIVIPVFVLGVVLGYILGRITSKKSGASPVELKKMRKDARVAIESRIAKRKDRIVEYAQTHGRVQNDDVEDMFCISDDTARRYLIALRDAGTLRQVGETGRGVHYVIPGGAHAQAPETPYTALK